MRKTIVATILLGLILVLAACTGGNTDSDGNTEVDNSTGETESTSFLDLSTLNNDIEIKATNFQFDQTEYTVKAGEEVNISLVNDEGMHGIAIDDFDVKIDGDGDAVFIPEEPGEYIIYCSIPCGEGHNNMVSTLIVQ